ncbi:Bac-surface-Ag domain-containing protein [Mycena indigotica]|uniref:Bac-surface-Ag domain-containing protein n=1 Tax=Mycena indigotica TaxID=2126181 RepID=A0A8H6T267_9AGAR|nr:Bac-surface-Ag domain-containing protein [Mycena indigotica]KAF7309495.1 Bac-surface-Ag domain-containing protein [Mycena indigotica]
MADSEPEGPRLHPPLQHSVSPRDLEPDEKDLEKIRQWQEARIEKKLRGEYESTVIQLQDIINNNASTPSQISSVRVEGGQYYTRPSFLGSVISPLLPPPSEPNDLETVTKAAGRIASALLATGMYSSVDAKLERAKSPMAAPFDVDLVLTTRHKPRYFLSAKTEASEDEGSVSIVGRVVNAFGGAEMLEANLTRGTTTRMAADASLIFPLTSSLNTWGQLQSYVFERDYSGFASCTEAVRGAKALVRSGFPATGKHEFAYEAVVRHLGNLKPNASMSMREAAGQSVKSALSHAFVVDTRDENLVPTRGFYLRTVSELAGLGGDTAFLKSETHSHLSRPIFPGTSLSFSARSGVLWGLNGKPSLFPDRFQLGGPCSVRAFRFNSLGPRANRLPLHPASTSISSAADSIGGELYWSAGVSVISDFPTKPDWALKTHAWINAGRLDDLNKSRPIAETARGMLTRPSVSVGLGLIYNFAPARIELNFGLPLVANKSDGTRRGLQVGIGVEFL